MQDLIIKTTDSNEKAVTKTFQKIPSEASDANLIIFANSFKILTTQVDTIATKRVSTTLNLG